MANEITKVTDKNNVDHPLRDAAAQTALTGILNGQSIDSFGDVESAVKANTQLIKDTVGWTGKNKVNLKGLVDTSNNGVDFTIENNSNGDLLSIDANNTASGGNAIYISPPFLIKAGTYIFNGCPEGGGDSNYRLDLRDSQGVDWTSAGVVIDKGNGVEFTLANDEYATAYIRIANGTTVSHLKFKPMICDVSILDPTFEPYHESVQDILDTKSTVSVTHTGTASSTGVRKQQITVNNVSYDVDGSAYMEQSVTLSTSQSTDVVFTNAIIADGTELTFSSSIWDLVPDDMVTTTGVCTVTLPKWTSAVTIGCRLRVR